MDAIIAQRLSYVAETHGLLPSTHMGGRKGRSTEHAIHHHIIDKIYEAWSRGRASLLLLDVSGAFDTVSHQRLLHNLRKRKIDEKTVLWIASLLEDRYTRTSVDGIKTKQIKVRTGTVQGSPLSPILYTSYNADSIDQCNRADDTVATGFIDDVAILAWGDTTMKHAASFSRHSRAPSSGRGPTPRSSRPANSSSPTSPGHARESTPSSHCPQRGARSRPSQLASTSVLSWIRHCDGNPT
jgi:hypothetical protein